jgi:hypothetical protein
MAVFVIILLMDMANGLSLLADGTLVDCTDVGSNNEDDNDTTTRSTTNTKTTI